MTRTSAPSRKTRLKKAADAAPAMPLSRDAALAPIKRDPLGHLLVEKFLYDMKFSGSIATDTSTLEKYSTDESIFSIRPQIVLFPKTKRDIEIAVSVLNTESTRFKALSLTPRAAGTGLGGGSLTDSIVIDTCTHLASIGDVRVKSGEATITCEPGAMWRDVERKLKAKGYYLPCYPASKDICSIGGSVANNAAGPDSLRYGHVASWVESVEVILHDGNTYTLKPLSYKEFSKLIKTDNAHGRIAREVFELIEENQEVIKRARPKTHKNSAGYALWDVLDGSVAEFKRGVGTFDLTQIIAGSQGTLGVITSVTLRAEEIKDNTKLIAVPVFDLKGAGKVVEAALAFNPINVEVFDDLTYDLALQNPSFFRDRLSGIAYYKTLYTLYTTFHVRYRRKIPAFTLLITLDSDTTTDERMRDALAKVRVHAPSARLITNPYEVEMFWQVRRASYLLSKLQDPNKRPAAFLEDMVVPPKHLASFFTEIKRLLKKYNVTAAVHGHGGDGHFHFYPLLDFTSKATPALVMKMAEEFFDVALKYDGNLCGEHNDGIIRTPHLHKMFSKKVMDLFVELESIFDPHDIFNPGKKVNPRFDVKSSIRSTN